MDNISFPAYPIFNGYFQVIYSSKSLINDSIRNAPPYYVWNDPRQCLHLPKAIIQIGGLDCRPFNQVVEESYIMNLYISKHRLIDNIVDCYHEEDEKYQYSCLLNDTQRFLCQSKQICISPIGISTLSSDCRDEYISLTKPKSYLFAFLCNFIRCDNIFHCANGIDEFDCPNSYCNINEFKCTIDDSIDYLCISQANIYEKPINCSKHNDDEIICRKLFYSTNLINEKNEYLSWKEKTCLTDNDICGQPSLNNQHLICNHDTVSMSSLCNQLIWDINNNKPLCALQLGDVIFRYNRFFSKFNLGYFPSIINQTSLSSRNHINMKITTKVSMNTSIELIEYCNRSILIYEGKSYKKKCLCPPNYFGDQCQW
ncbi:unnamed protein product [Rotaria sordida]|uniref:EGF-like domain-containing protein n=1 Tax=Rotaria sordida TaxID=392033 RepID=A0A815N0V7_9BILA|nr:unnamed protein product [Rotaria sordida]